MIDVDETRRPVRFAGSSLDKSRHVCAFFDSPEEKYATLLPFIREGLERGEKAFQIVNPLNRDAYLARLEADGVEVSKAAGRGQLEVVTWQDAYLLDGHFEQERMVSMLGDVLATGEREYPMLRLTGEMEWALEDRPGVDQLVEYETRLNKTIYRTKHAII